MMIIKCHALSQLTFVNQFQNIRPADIKQIESLYYKFMWNWGPERVKRSTLKIDKLNGGIDGVDIECFLHAIKIRQYYKAELFCIPLNFIQKNCTMQEEISKSTRYILYKLLRWNWKLVDIDDLNIDTRIELSNIDLRLFVRPGTKTDTLLGNLTHSSLNSVLKYGRNITNKTIKILPAIFKQLICQDHPVTNSLPLVLIANKPKPINKISSKSLQELLKKSLNKSKEFSINSKYDLLCEGMLEEKRTWFNLWKISNPILRSCRLKIIYKDVFCQQRRFKFGLTDSPLCEVQETITH